MRVLGIDPGTVTTGWGLIEEKQSRLIHRASGTIRSHGSLPYRLAAIHEQVARLLEELVPSCVSLEKSFVGANIQSAFRLGEARGVILAATAQAKIEVQEYSPAEVKVAVAGAGRASKHQIQLMVARLLGMNRELQSDEADALATAICHLHRARMADLLEPGLTRARGRASSRAAWTRAAIGRGSGGR